MRQFDKGLALRLGRAALKYLRETEPEVLKWAIGTGKADFDKLTSTSFLRAYCWVVYASGFRFSTVKSLFPEIAAAFKNFDEKSLAGMRSIKPVLKVFNNERKARGFLSGAQRILDEGFSAFKERLEKHGPDVLLELGGIGPITKNHLAKNIGLADVAKADVWMVRAAALCNAASVGQLVDFLSGELELSAHAIDVAIWTFAKDGKMLELFDHKKGLVHARNGRT